MGGEMWPWSGLPLQAEVIERLARRVEGDDRWRWLEVCCSLAAGRGDGLSDVDACVGYGEGVDAGALTEAGLGLVGGIGTPLDVLAHVPPGSPETIRRLAVEFETGALLDLVLMPATQRPGLPTGSVAVVDKDGRLSSPWRPPVEGPPDAEAAREWLLLGWWALGDVAKYLRRGSLFEAVERLAEARQQALRLRAAGDGVPFPSFGLVSMLDFPPRDLPAGLEATYATPTDRHEVGAAALAVADLLDDAARRAGRAIGAPLGTAWADTVRRRLALVPRG